MPAARFLMSSARLAQDGSGVQPIIPNSLSQLRVRWYTYLHSRGSKRVGEPRLRDDVLHDKGVRSMQLNTVVDAVLACHVISLAHPIELLGGEKAPRGAVRLPGAPSLGGKWGDPAVANDIAQALELLDSMWSDFCILGIGMRGASRGLFHVRSPCTQRPPRMAQRPACHACPR